VINIYIYCGVYEHGLGIGGLPGRGQTPSTTPLIAAGRHVSNAKCEDDGATGGIPWACLSGRLSRTDWAHRATITWCRACPVSQHNPEKIEMHMPQPAHFSVSIATRSNPYRCDARRMLLRREGGNGQAAGKARWHIIITYSSIKDWVCGKKINFQPASVSGPSSAEFGLRSPRLLVSRVLDLLSFALRGNCAWSHWAFHCRRYLLQYSLLAVQRPFFPCHPSPASPATSPRFLVVVVARRSCRPVIPFYRLSLHTRSSPGCPAFATAFFPPISPSAILVPSPSLPTRTSISLHSLASSHPASPPRSKNNHRHSNNTPCPITNLSTDLAQAFQLV
jgi:hypothetical protein